MSAHPHNDSPEDSRYRDISYLLHSGNAHAAEAAARALAEQSDCHANALLGAIFEFGGKDFRPNQALALEYYRTSIDMCGNVEGCLGAARIMYLGLSESRNLEEAFHIYKTTADLSGNYVAQYMTAKMYLHGEGVNTDYLAAEKYARLALEGRNIHSFALLSQIFSARGQRIASCKWRLKRLLINVFSRPLYLDRKI